MRPHELIKSAKPRVDFIILRSDDVESFAATSAETMDWLIDNEDEADHAAIFDIKYRRWIDAADWRRELVEDAAAQVSHIEAETRALRAEMVG